MSTENTVTVTNTTPPAPADKQMQDTASAVITPGTGTANVEGLAQAVGGENSPPIQVPPPNADPAAAPPPVDSGVVADLESKLTAATTALETAATANQELQQKNDVLQSTITTMQANANLLNDEIVALKTPAPPPTPAPPAAEGLGERIMDDIKGANQVIEDWFKEHFHVDKLKMIERSEWRDEEQKRVSAAVSELKGKLGV